MRCIGDMIRRGMIQSLTVPQKKIGAGRVTIARRSPDLRLEESWNYKHMPKILDVMANIQSKSPIFYCGFDPTAESLHLGHMTVLSVMLDLLKNGNRVIALIGGATAQLGDPTGKTETRTISSNETLELNSVALEKQLTQIFNRYCSKHDINCDNFSVLNNKHWYTSITLADYMEAIGNEFKVIDMLDRSVVTSRLESEGSDMRFAEFVYKTFQCYDWLHLYKQYGCTVQIGGYDQIGNIEDGFAYMWRRLDDKPEVAGITVPLVVTEDGEKLGKTSGNAVWLDQSMASNQSLREYLDSLSINDMLPLAHKLTPHSTKELQDKSQTELAGLVNEELLPLIT